MNEPTSQDIPVWVVVLIPLAFFLIFPLIWCFVMWINSQVSGWRSLAKHYRSNAEPEGTRWDGVLGRVGLVSYKGVLDCVTNEEGLFLQPGMLFKFAHPRLFIPWTELHGVKRSRIPWMAMVSAEIGQPKLGSLAIEEKVFEGSAGKRLLSA